MCEWPSITHEQSLEILAVDSKYQSINPESKSLDHFRLLVGYRTKDGDALKDYYFTIGKDISIFKLLELEPIWRTPQHRKGLINFDFHRCLYNGKATAVYLTRHKISGKFHALKLIKKDRISSKKAEMIKN